MSEREDIAEKGREEAELGRAAAETSRVTAESDRLIAEGPIAARTEQSRVEAETGRVDTEDGRVTAEGGRVNAEAIRKENARNVYRRVMTLFALPVALVAILPTVIFGISLHREITTRCDDAAINRTAIRGSIINGLGSLGYRYDDETGTAIEDGKPLDYYTTHEAERKQALNNALITLRSFPLIKC